MDCFLSLKFFKDFFNYFFFTHQKELIQGF